MDLEARAKALVAEILGRRGVGVAPRIERAKPSRPAERDAGRDHRVLDTSAAETPQHAARVQARDARTQDRDAGRGVGAVDAADERGNASVALDLPCPAAL